MPFLIAEHLTKTYPDSENKLRILTDINLTVNPGEFISISGQSGCGKSTLLHLLGLLDMPDSGTLAIDGLRINPNSADAPAFRNQKLGFVFQFHYLMDDLTALENVTVPLLIASQKKKQSLENAALLLNRLGLGKRLQHYPNQLSGGEQQRVALARALINKPQLILADEPTGNLDPEHSKEVVRLMFELNSELGCAFILVTHDQELAIQAQTRYRLSDGVLHLY